MTTAIIEEQRKSKLAKTTNRYTKRPEQPITNDIVLPQAEEDTSAENESRDRYE